MKEMCLGSEMVSNAVRPCDRFLGGRSLKRVEIIHNFEGKFLKPRKAFLISSPSTTNKSFPVFRLQSVPSPVSAYFLSGKSKSN